MSQPSDTLHNPMSLAGRSLLVTGASAGIGQATAVLLSRLGARVTLNGRDEGRLADTLSRLTPVSNGQGHRVAPFDMGDLDAIPAWMKEQAALSGPFDGVAHCAGIQTLRPIRIFSQDFFDQVMRVNLGSCLALAKGLRQKGVRAERSAMVFISSTAATAASPANIVYAAAKGGIIAATKGLSAELLPDGIRVNCVVPSIVMTDLIERGFEKLSQEQIDHLQRLQPLGFGHVDDVAHAIAYLLADTGRWITGTALTVDGGRTA
ncbi:NAD(P)-dependent dehydrogenase (short-subunit alcohol dehydrogenase family) [Nitrospirillum amazonense]|uniref:NAD(P)-dependent dehydrogenase (Short-subunit alcohol dehydrogenase family) n=1 Tax=Nitrospirillum amazonense TaxID=28077 RepID=A0A560FBJ4_9PROT|nr:SDR family oxidoreductase [Nitrospirillum amazonense]TWB18984.1 NAD(P)-dependent dehydrogenase (short-subunit alcohol dehydrogenase family) [Nitrospirillum amazonense]